MLAEGFDIVLRPATDADSERIMALVQGVLDEFGLPFDARSKDSDLQNIEEGYLRAGGIFELIEDRHGNLLGTWGLFPLDQETCELRKMYFIPQMRGIGLGRQILERAVGAARRLGFKTIVLETHSALKRAERLYTRFGFEPVEIEEVTARADRKYILKLR